MGNAHWVDALAAVEAMARMSELEAVFVADGIARGIDVIIVVVVIILVHVAVTMSIAIIGISMIVFASKAEN